MSWFSRPAALKHAASAGGGAVLALTAAFTIPWEGVRTSTYTDIVGVETVCAGETARAAVEEGKRRAFTKGECTDMLARSLPKYYEGMKHCVNRDLPTSMQVAFTSTAYNIGVKAFCGSSMARLAAAGDYRGACEALLNWNRAGGHVVRGLDNRRHAERDKCLEDVP